MLILRRRSGEKIYLILEDGREIIVTHLGTIVNQVRIGFEAPETINIVREEVRIRDNNKLLAQAS